MGLSSQEVDNSLDSSVLQEKNLTQIIETFKSTWPVEQWKKFGLFDDDYLLKINLHWMKFPPPSPSSHYLLSFFYGLIMTVGIIGNVLIIVTFLKTRYLRTPSNLFVLNLAVSDFLLLSKAPLFIINSIYLGPVLGKIGCSTYGFVGGLTGTVSIMTLAAIAFERYQVIAYPLARKTKTSIYFQILSIWIYAAFFSIIPLLDIGLNKYVPEGYLTSCSFDYLDRDFLSRLSIFVFFIAAFVFPLSVIIGSYSAMYRIVFRAHRSQFQNMTRHCKEMEIRRTETKVAVTVIFVISLWILSWTPYAAIALLGITGNEKFVTPTSSMIPAIFCKTASCIDPFVYALRNQRFKNALKRTRFCTSSKSERKDFWTNFEETVNFDKGRELKREPSGNIIVFTTSFF